MWIRLNQLARRNLTAAWKIELQWRNKADLLEKGKQTQGARNDILSKIDTKSAPEPHSTREQIAAGAGVSTGMVGMAAPRKLLSICDNDFPAE